MNKNILTLEKSVSPTAADIKIHKTAVVAETVKCAPGVDIGPYAIIEGNVVLEENVQIGSHCLIKGNTHIGAGTKVYNGAVIGSEPQVKKIVDEKVVSLYIGRKNIIREYVTINTGTVEGGGKTLVGDENIFMAYSHIAHDCVVGNGCVIANAGTLAGHVTLEDRAVVGGLSAVHQFSTVGTLSIIGGCSKVTQDVPPYSMCDGHPARVYNVNSIGLKRSNMSPDSIKALKKAFRILFHSGKSRRSGLESLMNDLPQLPEIQYLIKFIQKSERGVCS